MENKEKQIEEMAKIMCSPCPDGKECSGTWCYKRVLDCANEFYEQGYCKILKGSVVLSKEEWENLCKEKNDYKQRFESSEKRYEQLVQSSCEALEKKGKETAVKILKWLVETGVINTAPDTTKMYFKEEFGVEIKE